MLKLAKAILITGLLASFSTAQAPPPPGERHEALLKKLDRLMERLDAVEARLDAIAAQAEPADENNTKTGGAIYLKNIDVNTLRPHVRVLRDLSGSETLTLSVDERTNAIIFASAPDKFVETQAVITAWIEELDQPAPTVTKSQPRVQAIGVPDEKELERRWRRLQELRMPQPNNIAPPGKRGAERVNHDSELLPHDL